MTPFHRYTVCAIASAVLLSGCFFRTTSPGVAQSDLSSASLRRYPADDGTGPPPDLQNLTRGLTPRQAGRLMTIANNVRPKSSQEFHQRGLQYFLLGENGVPSAYRLAIEDFTEALLLNPALLGPHSNRARAYLRIGAVEAALADFERAVDLDAENPELRIRQASVLTIAGRDAEAVLAYDMAYALGSIDSVFNRAKAHLRLGQRALALRDFAIVAEESRTPKVARAAMAHLQGIP